MTWLTPMTGVLLAAAVIPPLVLLYFLKLRRRLHPISSTLLWTQSVEDLHANVPFQRLRMNLLLFLQLVALLLLIASIMQPRIEGGAARGGTSILLVDRSASMTAVDAEGGATRLEEAKRLARDMVRRRHAGGLFGRAEGRTMVITFAEGAEVACPFTDSQRQLLAAIDAIEPTHGRSRIGDALRLARAYATNVNPDAVDRPITEPADLELYSDGRIEDLDKQVLRGETLRYHRIGGLDTGNVAVTGISAERPWDRPGAVEIFTSLVNHEPVEVACDIQLSVDGRALGIREVTLPPAETDPSTGALVPGRNNLVWTPFDLPGGAVIEVANLHPDALAVDDVATIVVPPPKRLAVALVATGPSAVRTVLEGMRLRRLELLTPGRYESLAEAGELDRFDVVVLDGYAPRTMPPGHYFTTGATPPLAGLHAYGTGERQVLLDGKDDDPVLRYVQYDRVFTTRFTKIEPAEDVEVLLEGSIAPAVLRVTRGRMRVIHVAFDLLDSNWPLMRTFSHFVVNVVHHLGHLGESLTSRGFVPGEALTTRLPADASRIELVTPGGATITLEPTDPTMLTWGPIQLAGLHVLRWSDGTGDETRYVSVNLAGSTEGRLAAAERLTIGSEQVEGRGAAASRFIALWPLAMGVCLVVLMLEWWTYHRRLGM